MIPSAMTGGWLRNGIAIDGAAPTEDSVVWWLQGPSKHCDLRAPLHSGSNSTNSVGVMCFAGTTSWNDPSLSWAPEIELDPSAYEDTGVITWDGTDMIETGVFRDGEHDVPYVERWQRLPGSDGEQLSLSLSIGSTTGRLVRAGLYALTIIDGRMVGDPFVAVAWTLHDSDGQDPHWAVDHCWPPGAVAPAPPLTVGDGIPTVVLSDNTEWSIDEQRKVATISD